MIRDPIALVEIAELKAENDRLREALEAATTWEIQLDKVLAENKRLRAENAERDEIRHRAVELDHALTEMLKLLDAVEAENVRLREALEQIMALDLDEACAIANEALSKEAGQ